MEEGIIFWTLFMENIVRDSMEDIHSNKELSQDDMKSMNIQLRNNIYTYLVDNKLKINVETLYELLNNILNPYRDIVKDKDLFDRNIKDSIRDIVKVLREVRNNPELMNSIVQRNRGFKYEPPTYIGSR